MQDEDKTKEQLIGEMAVLRKRVAELEKGKGASIDATANADELRRRAEKQVREKQTETDRPQTKEHAEKLSHELQVHQIELEMQNEELRNTLEQLEESRSTYSDLYEFAPVGYLTLDENGLVLKGNLTIARQLGIERSYLINSPFPVYLVPADRNVFRSHLNEVFTSKQRQSCQIGLMAKPGGDSYAHLDSVFVQDSGGKKLCRTTVTCITVRKRIEEEMRHKTALLEAQAHSTIDAILVVDSQGKKIFQNKRTIDLWKIPQHIADSDDDKAQVEHVMHATKYPEQFVEKVAYLYNHPNETSRDEIGLVDGTVLDRYSAPVLGKDGQHYGRIWTFRDITERRRAEEALKKSEERFNLSMEATNDGLWDWNLETDGGYFSPGYYRMLGYEVGAFPAKGNAWQELIHPEDRENALRKNMDCVEGLRESFEVEFRMKAKNGDWRWILGRGKCIARDEQGRALRLVGTHMDITERKHAEEAMHEEQTLIKTMIESIPGAFYMLDAEGCYVRWNAYQRDEIVGKHEDQMAGAKAIDIIHPDDREIVGSRIESILRNRSSEVIAGRVLLRGGPEYRWLLLTGRSILIKEKPFLIGIGIDITDQKRAEAALRQSHDRFVATLSSLDEAVFLVDPATRLISECNDATARVFGYEREELVGKDSHSLHVDQAHFEQFGRAAMTAYAGPGYYTTESEMRRKDGSVFPTEHFVRPVRDPDGRILYVVSVVRDITQRKRDEGEKAELEGQLQQAQKMESVGRLAGGVAHDFNNMLSIILGHAEMVLDEIAPGDLFYHDVMEIKNAAQRSADLTRQLLAFARKQIISPKILDLNETASGILNMLRRLVGEDINLAWVPGLDVWPVKIDPSQIDQILANLAVNARDAIGGVGTMTIETANVVFDKTYCQFHNSFTPGSYVLLVVSDTGAGMDKQTIDKIFEPFFTTKELGKGTGLGLATVYGIVKQNNGFINVHSEPGQGTTFKIYLPRVEQQIDEKPAQAGEKDLRGTETVLLVEDEEPILALGKAILERRGYTVLAAHRPDEAMRIVQSHAGQIHVLITDVVMPGMNGKDLRDKLDTVKPGFKCIFMSGYTADVIAQRGVLDEGIQFLQKPFSVKTLTEKVREVLDT